MPTHLSLLPLREESLLQNSLCRYLQEWEELDKYTFTVKQCKYVNLYGGKFSSNYNFTNTFSLPSVVPLKLCLSVEFNLCKSKILPRYLQHNSVITFSENFCPTLQKCTVYKEVNSNEL